MRSHSVHRVAPLPPETVTRLRALHEQVQATKKAEQRTREELWREAARVCAEKDVTIRAVAEALGVSSGTVQAWVTRARQLDDSPV